MGDKTQRATLSAARTRAALALTLLLLGMQLGRTTDASAPLLFSLSAALALLALPLRFLAARRILLTTAILFLGAAWWSARINQTPGTLTDLLRTQTKSPAILTVQGRILERPDVSNTSRGELAPFIPYTPAARFNLDVHRIKTDHGWIRADGIFRIRVGGIDGVDRGTIGPARAGDLITITGLATPITSLGNPGEPNLREWAAQQGIAGNLSADDPRLIELVPSDEDSAIGRLRSAYLRWRASLTHAAELALSPTPIDTSLAAANPSLVRRQEARSLILSLTLGIDEQRQDQVQQRFTRLGVVHVLAISGYHIVLLATLVGGAIRLTGDRGRLESLLIAAAILAYALVVPASAPVLRAVVCVLVLMATRALGRRYDTVCTLLWTAAVLALWKPVDAFSLGFILSFGLCIVLLLLSDRFHARITRPRLRGLLRPRRSLWRSAASASARFSTATFLCWAASAPLLAWWTGILTPITFFASLLIVPAAAVLLTAGFLALFLGLVAQLLTTHHAASFSTILLTPIEYLAAAMLAAIDLLDRVPLATLRLPPLSLAWMLAATVLAFHWIARGHARDTRAWLATALLAAWLAVPAITSWRAQGLDGASPLTADVLSVGDGACILIRARAAGGEPDHVQTVLIDAGSSRQGLGLRAIPDACRNLGCWRVSTAIVLGADPKHFSCLPDTARAIRIRRVLAAQTLLDAANTDPSGIQAAFLRTLRERGIDIIPIDAGARIPLTAQLAIEFDRGAQSLRARIIDRDSSSTTPSAPTTRALITRDAPATPLSCDTVLAAGSATTDHAFNQLQREIHAAHYILSDAFDPRASPSDASVHAATLRTSTSGHIQIRWSIAGEAMISTARTPR